MDVPIVQAANSASDCEGQRKEINSDFNPDKIELLAGLIIDYLTSEVNPNYNVGSDPAFLKYTVVAEHSDFNNLTSTGAGVWHSNNETFFSWHRDYIQGLEQFLLDMGYPEFVPLPAWNPSTAMPEAFTTAVVGGVGQLNNPDFEADMYVVDDITCGQFDNIDEFAGWIRASANAPGSGADVTNHNLVHVGIGGAMGNVRTASGAAIFWLFHAHVDELYQCYQTRCQDCEPVFIRATGEAKGCRYCFDFSLSVNADEIISVTLIDENGIAVNIPWPNYRTCIPSSYLESEQNYSVIISATNSTDDMCNAADEVEIKFTAPIIPKPSKFNNPCTRVIATPQFPIPIDNFDTNPTFLVTNTGPARDFTFIQTPLMNGQSVILEDNLRLAQDESIQVEIPRRTIAVGYNIFSVIVEDEAMSVDYLLMD